MQRSPALVVPSVDVAPALHQKLHHLRIFVNASLPDTGLEHTLQSRFCKGQKLFWLKRCSRFSNLLKGNRGTWAKTMATVSAASNDLLKWAANSPKVLSKQQRQGNSSSI